MHISHSAFVVSTASAVVAAGVVAPAAQAVTIAPSADGSACVIVADEREQELFELDAATTEIRKDRVPALAADMRAKYYGAKAAATDEREYMEQLSGQEKIDRYQDVLFYEEEAAQYNHMYLGLLNCMNGTDYDSNDLGGSINEVSSIYETDPSEIFLGLSRDSGAESDGSQLDNGAKIAIGVVAALAVLGGILAAAAPLLTQFLPTNIAAMLP